MMLLLSRLLRALADAFRAKPAWALKTNQGYDAEVVGMFGDVTLPVAAGTTTAISATTATDSGGVFGTNVYKWHMLIVGTVYGIIQSHTGTVITVDRWYSLTTPGGSAASTPGATTAYMILPVGGPCNFIHLTTTGSFTPASGDTTLSGEITTAGGGLVAKLATVAHVAGTSTATLTTVHTANGSDSLPAVVTGIAVTGSIVAAKGPLLYESAYGSTATVAASGDQLTSVDTITL